MGLISAPNDAITHGSLSTIGYNGGPAFGIESFYGAAFCRNYIRINMTGFYRVSLCHTRIPAQTDVQ